MNSKLAVVAFPWFYKMHNTYELQWQWLVNFFHKYAYDCLKMRFCFPSDYKYSYLAALLLLIFGSICFFKSFTWCHTKLPPKKWKNVTLDTWMSKFLLPVDRIECCCWNKGGHVSNINGMETFVLHLCFVIH